MVIALSKSARRRQQLLRRGQRMEVAVVNNANQPPKQKKKKRSGRNRRSRDGGPNNISFTAAERLNPYLASLMEPERPTDARVPDMTGIQTCVVQVPFQASVSVSADGTMGFWVDPHMYNNALQYAASTSTATTITYATAFAFPNASQYYQVYQACRPISAVIYVDYIGTSSNDSGVITGAWQARGSTNPSSTTDASNRFASETAPAKLGMKILWRPQDNADLEFAPTGSASAPLANRPKIGFTCSGMLGSSTPLRVRAFINFECIPYSDLMDIAQPTPSPINIGNLEAAFRWGQDMVDKITTLIPYAETVATVGMNAATYFLGGRSGMRGTASMPSR